MADFIVYCVIFLAIMFADLFFNMKGKRKFFKSLIDKYGLFFRLVIASSFLIVLVGLTSHIQTEKQELLFTERAKFFISGLVVIGILYTILAFEFNVKKNREDKRSQLGLNTFQILSTWHNSPFTDYSKTMHVFEKSPNYLLLKNDLDKFSEFFDSGTPESVEIRRAFNGIFNYFEIICAGIKEGVIDGKFVKRYFDYVFRSYYEDWIEFIEKRRLISDNLFCEYTIFTEEKCI